MNRGRNITSPMTMTTSNTNMTDEKQKNNIEDGKLSQRVVIGG